MTRAHYHVWNQYADEPVFVGTNRKEAERAIVEESRVWRYDMGAHVTGNARDGYSIQWEKDGMGSWRLWLEECPIGPECELLEEWSQ